MKVIVMKQNETYELLCKDGQTIMDAMAKDDRYFSASCGGQGTCGKCRIRVLSGNLPVTKWDEAAFSQKEIEAGWRLACKAVPETDCTISFNLDDELSFEIADTFETASIKKEALDKESLIGNHYGIAIDIGTTTIALSLVGIGDGKCQKVCTSVNHQRMYGADVITRIQASNEGKGKNLQASIRRDLTDGIRKLLEESKISARQIEELVIAGNTTMGHLLMGFSCEGLGVYPFTPVNIGTIQESAEKVLGEDILNCPAVLIPGISTYVGADITSGILACQMAEKEEVSLLIDFGTNGEMALGNKDRLYVTSTAAGPAFEGGNISCGMGSVRGAICGVEIAEDGTVKTETIGNQPPLGLCGTGVIETVAELVKTGLVDETGYLDEAYEDGFPLGKADDSREILFMPKDVREVQLAKAAIRAGMESLMLRYGVTYEQVKTIYLAGGFGLKINQDKAIQIGMLPEEFKGKIKTVGNSSLGGAMRYLVSKDSRKLAEKIVDISTEISLSMDKDFNEFYMEHMYF